MIAANQDDFPVAGAARDRWIIEHRGSREQLDPEKPHAFLVEDEHFADGSIGSVATLFLTNRECPWRCTMCDLWRNTLTQSVPTGVIPAQIDYALARLPPAQHIKLYNSGSFFDPRAIPVEDYSAIAERLTRFERVIVESHPSLIGDNCFRFQHRLTTQLEVAMGLETAHPAVLEKLNKKMTLAQYAHAAEKLRARGIALRSFVLIQPPFMPPAESLHWACKSVDCAIDCGAAAITLIPTRTGNGAMEELSRSGHFTPPILSTIEAALAYGIGLNRARVYIDLWDTAQVIAPPCCRDARIERLRQVNLSQILRPFIECAQCGPGA